MATNQERLNNNINTTKVNIQNYINSDLNINIIEKSSLDELLNTFEYYSGVNNLSALSVELEKERDLALGITWKQYPDKDGEANERKQGAHTDGTVDLIRDATRQKEILHKRKQTIEQAEKRAEQFSAAIGILNLHQAATEVLSIENKLDDARKNQLDEKLRGELQKLKDPANKLNFKKAVDDFLKIVKDAGVADAKHKVEMARDYVSMKNPQFHITTISKVGDKDTARYIIESETALLGLTKKQEENYTGKNDKEWYKEQSKFGRQLIDKYTPKILEGNTILPIQTLDSLPGIRNAYVKTTYVATQSNKELDEVNKTLHSGTITYHGKKQDGKVIDDQNKHVMDNIEQMQSFFPDKEVVFNSLNHRIIPETVRVFFGGLLPKGKHDEQYILDPLKKAVESYNEEIKKHNEVLQAKSEIDKEMSDKYGDEEGHETSKQNETKDLKPVGRFVVSLNPFVAGINSKSHGLYTDSEKGFADQLKNVENGFVTITGERLGEALKHSNLSISKKKVLPYVESPELREVLDALIDAHNAHRSLTNSSILKSIANKVVSFFGIETGYDGPARAGLNLAAAMKRFTFLCDKHANALKGMGIEYTAPLIDTFCKSGKDRTGLTEATATWQSVSYKILDEKLRELKNSYNKDLLYCDALLYDAKGDDYATKLADGRKDHVESQYKKGVQKLYDEAKKLEQEFLKAQVDAKHTQIIPSLNAGTPGSHGVIDAMSGLFNKGELQGRIIEKNAKQNHMKGEGSWMTTIKKWFSKSEEKATTNTSTENKSHIPNNDVHHKVISKSPDVREDWTKDFMELTPVQKSYVTQLEESLNKNDGKSAIHK